MKKLFIGVAMLFFAQAGFGQAVNESAIIPVSVTLNAVSRLTIESGGNIKFVFNSINDYETGFTGEDETLYRTTVSISSSRDFSVSMYAESDQFIPTDNAANTLVIGNLEYQLDWTGLAANTPTTYTDSWDQMTDISALIIDNTAGDGGVAGSGTDNRFDIWWRIGHTDNTLGTFLDQGNIAADHYVANIFIELTE